MNERTKSVSVRVKVHSRAESRPHLALLMLIVAAFAFTAACPTHTTANDRTDGAGCLMPLASCHADVDPLGGNGVVDVNDLLVVIDTWGQSGLDGLRPQGDCDPLPNGDCTTNVEDLIAVINEWGVCPAQPEVPIGACLLPNNTCTVNTSSQCAAAGGTWVSNASCIDSDGDRIPDAFELNTCDSVTPLYGTDPNHWDTDGDNLPDGDEVYGTTAGLDLPALGCDPLRKNLLLEIDWFEDTADSGWFPVFHSHRPHIDAVTAVVDAFDDSPVTNPCGDTGITLIIDRGQGFPFTGGNQIPGDIEVVVWDSEFNSYKDDHFADNRKGYFYYSIHCHRYDEPNNNKSGKAELGGNDHIVSLQKTLNVSKVSKTIMHELGHNLTLRHGGFEDLNFKPNYNSVMNYRYQFAGVDTDCTGIGDGGLGYSHGENPDLDEQLLDEATGICGVPFGIDWNNDNTINLGTIARSINCKPTKSTACTFPSPNPNLDCWDNDCGLLRDNNDWAQIAFTGLDDPDDVPPETIECDAP